MQPLASSPVHVVGASGRSGAALCRALLARNVQVVPLVRDRARWSATAIALEPRLADLTDLDTLAAALHGAVRIAITAHARHAAAILAAAPADTRRLVFLGSTRKFTLWPDTHGNGVLAGEAAILASARSAMILHPTMIYGAAGENNVRRLAALIRRLPFVPLPDGGRALVQPIHQSDVTASVLAALDLHPLDGPEAIVVAGPEPLSYAAFVQKVAAAAGQRRPPIVPVPRSALLAAAPLLAALPFLPSIGRDEIRRLGEDKSFDIHPMRDRLGVTPVPLEEGLAMTFDR